MRGKVLWMLVLAPLAGLAQPAAEVPCDELGVRRFSAVPPVGVHPRVLLSPEDIPRWREQVGQTHRGGAFFARRYRSGVIDRLLAIAAGASDAELVAAFTDKGPTHDFLNAAMDAVYHQDAARSAEVARALTTFARVLLARSRVDPKWGQVKQDVNGIRGLDGIAAGLGEIWYRGGSSYALAYDLLYNAMSEEQRTLCRQAIATSVGNLVTWGMGFPKGRAVSNWYSYHGEIPLMWLAIEGEQGFDKARYELFTRLLHDWFDLALHPGGGGNEDGYMANTGFREGTMAMVALARRGDNLFHHPNYLPYWTWVVQSLPPGGNGGQSVSYACNAVAPYESMPALSRWAMPRNKLVNYYWRQYKGADYARNNQWQYNDLSTLLAMDWEDSAALPLDPGKLGLPLSQTFPQLGLFVARSDWGPEALYVNAYCRQDAWMDRHEAIDRGRFVLCAGGRSWIGGTWNNSESQGGETVVQIDGQGQRTATGKGRMITPNGNLVASYESADLSAACLDLERCYNWQWANSFDYPGPGWEPETSTLAELGWLWPKPGMPKALFGADDAKAPAYNFAGCNFWRKAANPLRFAFRTLALARGAHPYAVLVDDFQKDDQPHRYESLLQVPTDVSLSPAPGGGWLLGDGGPRRLLLRPLGTGAVAATLEDYTIPGYGGKPDPRRRVVLTARAVSPDFKVLLCAVDAGQEPPAVAVTEAGATLRWADQEDRLGFARAANGLTRLWVKRGAKTLFGGFESVRRFPSAKPGAGLVTAAPAAKDALLWLAADQQVTQTDGRVSAWRDLSPNAAELVAAPHGPTLVAEAVGGRPALRFDGQGSRLRLSSPSPALAGTMTVFLVWAAPSRQADGAQGGGNNRLLSAASAEGADYAKGLSLTNGRNEIIGPTLTVKTFENVPPIVDLGLGAMVDGRGGVVGFRASVDLAELLIVPGLPDPARLAAISNYLSTRYRLDPAR